MTLLPHFSLIFLGLVVWLGFAKVVPLFLKGEEGFMRLLEAVEVVPRWTANNAKFIARLGIEKGLLRGFRFELRGTTVTDSALNDDAPWTLVSTLQITLPLKTGNVVISTTGRDAYLYSRYITGKLEENQTAATAGVTFSSFFFPFGPDGWGIHSEDFRPNSEIVITGTWGAAAEYGASTSDITAGILRTYLVVDENAQYMKGRLALVPVTTPVVVETERREPGVTVNKPERAEGLFGLLYRQEDSSAAADRVDGLVTRIVADHPELGTLHDAHFTQIRQMGILWAGIDPAQVTAALPLGLDGTAFFPCAPRYHSMPPINRQDIKLTVDSAEAVPVGVTNVSPAAGDRLHVTLVATIRPGG